MKAKFLLTIFLILGVAAFASADPATYSPSAKSIAGTKAFQNSHDLTLTSPPKLNKTGDDALAGDGITVEVKVTGVTLPAGGSMAEALSFISFESSAVGANCPAADGKCYLTYTALSQGKVVMVGIDVPSSATTGDYVYTIAGDPPSGLGWGVSGATLNLSIAAPSTVDTDPPIVTINSPSDNYSFTFCSDGTPVSIDFEAVDTQSNIATMAADVDGYDVSLSTLDVGTA